MRESHHGIAEQSERKLPLIRKHVNTSSEQKDSGARNSGIGWTLSFVSIVKGKNSVRVIKEELFCPCLEDR
jgi:hypothetical protein